MQDWLAVAKGLPYGQRTKIVCCASDRSCIVEHSAKGYRAWCFRCDPQTPVRFVPHGMRSIKELQEINAATARLLTSRECSLPADYTSSLSPFAMKWLLTAGIGTALSEHYSIGYSPALGRVVVPIYSLGGQRTLNSVLLRSLDRAVKPKYLLMSRNPSDAVFLSDPDTILPSALSAGTVHAYDIVITEDVLSAIRVGRHTSAGALLGTGVSAERLHKLLQRPATDTGVEWYNHETSALRIGLWLDPDKAGTAAGKKLYRSLTLQGHKCTIIRTEQDPKLYSDNQIRSILLAGHCSTTDIKEPEGVHVAL